MTNRITLILALLGMVLTLHMWVQKQRGFGEDCFSAPTVQLQSATISGCQEAMESDSGSLIGIDNVITGFSFYVFMAVLCLGSIFATTAAKRLLGYAKLGISGIALLVSLYLVYILFVQLDTLCVLCLTSATLVVTIFSLQFFAFKKKKDSAAGEDKDARAIVNELGVATLVSFAAGVLLIVDLIFIINIAGAGVAGGTDTQGMRAVANSVLEDRIDTAFLQRMAPCAIDDAKPAVAWQSLIEPTDPFMGNPDARITVVEFFDPNCPHCKIVHQVMKRVVERFSNRVQFYFKPYALWPKSLSQIEAIWLAAEQNRYFEMIERQFHAQNTDGLSIETIRMIGENLNLNGAELEGALQQQKYRQKVLQDKQMIKAAGINSAPVILLNGRFIGKPGQTLTVDCISNLIEKELLQ